MRRIFPLKSAVVSSNQVQSGPVSTDSSKARSVPSRYASEISKRVPPRSKKSDASTSQEMNSPTLRNRREHWCPACPAAENGVRCDTPPSGDENTAGKEVEKGVISPIEDSSRVFSRQSQDNDQSLDLAETLKTVVAGAMRGAESRALSVDKYTSRRSGLGVADNLTRERNVKQPIKSKAPQQESLRATSAPKVRPISRNPQVDAHRIHSMRIMKVPDRVFETPIEPAGRGSDGSSSTENGTPRARSVYERQKVDLPPVRTHGRAQSFSEALGSTKCEKLVANSPSHSFRKPIESPRVTRKESGVPRSTELTGKSQNKYSGARVVAERLAKAFRGSSKSSAKDARVDRSPPGKTTLGHSKRVYGEHSDASYDGSCSESSIQTCDENVVNVVPLERPGPLHAQAVGSRQDQINQEENKLTWQEFVTDGRVPEGLLNDNPVSESHPEASSNSSYENNSASKDSRRWPSASDDRNLRPSPQQQDDPEREILKAWLEGLKRQSEGLNDDLDMKARMAEQRLSVLNGEQSLLDDQLDFLHELQGKDINGPSNLAAGISIMQHRIRRMHDEKKRLALEVASEVKRRVTERAAAKEVLVMMKREMEACVRVMEKEKLNIKSGFDKELEKRDDEWRSKLETINVEEKWLRERLARLEEEKGELQSELSAVSLRESCLREKVRDFELQMDGHRKRVEVAEKTILDLRQSLVSNSEHAINAENELETCTKACLQKESQCQDLVLQVERLRRLCADHESSIQGLQQGLKTGVSGGTLLAVTNELARLSEVEKTLRGELESLRSETSSLRRENNALAERLGSTKGEQVGDIDQSLQADLRTLQLRTAELQDENNMLSFNLQFAVAERDSGREVLKTLEYNLSGVEKDTKDLQEEIARERNKVQEKEREIQRLERRVDGLLKNNQMLQGILSMREKAASVADGEVKEKEKAINEAHQLELEMRESLQVSARQLSFMNERVEILSEKLQERDLQVSDVKKECGKKDELISGLENSLKDLTKSVDAQNKRIMQLSNKNAELYRHLQARGKEVEDLHSKIVEDSQNRKSSNEELDQISVQARDTQKELEAQNLLCKLLRDKLAQREDDLEKRTEEVTALGRARDWLQVELKRLQTSLGDASQRLASLERTLRQKDELLVTLKAEKEEHLQDLSNLREQIPRIECQRDEMRNEAEDIGREALRLSAEVEVLRRKVAQLEEDVMVKEGQISILRGSFGGSE